MNRERLITAALFVAAMLAGLFVAGLILSYMSSDEPDYVSGALERAVQDPQQREIALRDMTNFFWRKAVVIPPYTPQEKVNQLLGFDWPLYQEFGVQENDGDNLIVFLDGRAVLYASRHPRNKGDFAPASVNKMMDPESAVFIVEHGNRAVLRLASLK